MRQILSVLLVLAATTVASAQCVGGNCGVQRSLFNRAPVFSRPLTPMFQSRSYGFRSVPRSYYTPSYRVVVPRSVYRVYTPPVYSGGVVVGGPSCVGCQ